MNERSLPLSVTVLRRVSPSHVTLGAAALCRFALCRFALCRFALGRFALGTGLGVCLTLLSPRAEAAPASVPPEHGYNYGETETPRMTATAGAMRALGNSTTALFANPANMAISHVYHITGMAQIYPEANRQSYGGAIVDSVVNATGLAGGVGGSWSQQDPEGVGREWMDLRAGLAVPIGKMFFVGASGRVFSLIENGGGPLGTSPISGGIPGSNIINTVTFDAGATFRPVEQFSVAITGHNLTNTGTGYLPLMGGASAALTVADFGLGVDAILEGTTYGAPKVRLMAGGEFLAGDVVAIRAGYRFDQGQESHSVSAGLGYLDRRFSVDAAFRRTIIGPESMAIVFGFSLHIEALNMNVGAIN